MKIDLQKVTVQDLTDGYVDDGEGGVRGYGGRLDIRPAYQREFIYGDKERNAVIDTVSKRFPLNVMYWADAGDGTYEVIDGQQRTISIAQYVQGDFALPLFGFGEEREFHNLEDDEQEQIRGYELDVYVCQGNDSDKLAWFRTINIAGKTLTDQELRNAVYRGPWVSDAKKWFSRPNAPAAAVGGKLVNGEPIRQKFLETAICWKVKHEEGLGLQKVKDAQVERYMGAHRNDNTATALWNHFQTVINRVEAVFPNYRRKFMKGVDWGGLYEHLKDEGLDPDELEERVSDLMLDDEVQRKAGIYSYLLTGEEKHLNLRAFTDAQKQKVFEMKGGDCPSCEKTDLKLSEMEADHVKPWAEGGKTHEDNCQLLCKDCNRRKSNR